MTLRELRREFTVDVGSFSPARAAEIVAGIDRMAARGADVDRELGESVTVPGVGVVVTARGGVRKLTEVLAAVVRGFVESQRPASCETRIELRLNGRPFASVRENPMHLIVADDWPAGDYEVWVFCSCCGRLESEYWGRLSTYGGGLGVARRFDGLVMTQDDIADRVQSI